MLGNIQLTEFMRQAKRELRYTTSHRRGIMLGYDKINLDSLVKEGVISEAERRQACWELDLYYDHL
jgi:hypothetical protein